MQNKLHVFIYKIPYCTTVSVRICNLKVSRNINKIFLQIHVFIKDKSKVEISLNFVHSPRKNDVFNFLNYNVKSAFL